MATLTDVLKSRIKRQLGPDQYSIIIYLLSHTLSGQTRCNEQIPQFSDKVFTATMWIYSGCRLHQNCVSDVAGALKTKIDQPGVRSQLKPRLANCVGSEELRKDAR